jgi:serine protease Do
LKDNGTVTRARLGIYFDQSTSSNGTVVKDVVEDGPASKAGLRKADVIIALNGKAIDGRALRVAIGSMAPGTKVDLKVLRDGREQTYSVTLDAMPQETAAPRFRRS